MTLKSEISAVTCIPISASAKFAQFLGAAYWGLRQVVVYSCKQKTAEATVLNFQEVCRSASLPAPVRSILFLDFDSPSKNTKAKQTFLLAGLTNGTIAVMSWSPVAGKEPSGTLGEPRIVALGYLPVSLTTCIVGEERVVLAVGSRVTLIGCNNGRVIFSPVIVEVCFPFP